MGVHDVEIAGGFLEALEAAAKSGDRQPVYPLLAPDVEWVTPKLTLHGTDEVREKLIWGHPPEKLDIEFETGELTDLGGGRVAADIHEVYRMKETGDFAYARDRRIEVTVRDGRIARYEMRIVG